LPEEIARGRTIDGIRMEYSQSWGCEPEALILEVLEKPGLISRQWKVRVSLSPSHSQAGGLPNISSPTECQQNRALWNEADGKYTLNLTDGVKSVEPYPLAGAVYKNGQVQTVSFRVELGDTLEFYPVSKLGQLSWKLNISAQGLQAVAVVTHEKAGQFTLPEVIPQDATLCLKNIVVWQDAVPEGEYWDKEKFEADLLQSEITYGVHPWAWSNILATEGLEEVIIAEGNPPIPPEPSRIEDLVGVVQQHDSNESIDFFASKIRFVQEGDVLARKIPGEAGIAGKDVRGQEIPPPPFKDFQFKLKKNVRLSEDGLEVIAASAGLPIRSELTTYRVENIYILNQDVDLATGSIEFPGDVFIAGNVQDGLHIYSEGKVEIRGSTSRAEVRAEKGLVVNHNVIAGKLMVGERFVVRSELLKRIQEVHEQLTPCLIQSSELASSSNAQHLRPGQCLKLILEQRFPGLPKLAIELEKFVLGTKDELITQDLIVSVRTAKHFLAGLGPLDPKALPFLERINRVFEQLIFNISLEVPEKLNCLVDYVQGATIECGGSFECRKGTYNSIIRAEGDLKIEGVCRGGKIVSGGNVEIKELGGSGVSTTTVQFSGAKRLKVGFCHPNVVIIVDKEIIRIDEPYRSLEIYRESGRVQIERLRGV
jgi:uncharacterized protein